MDRRCPTATGSKRHRVLISSAHSCVPLFDVNCAVDSSRLYFSLCYLCLMMMFDDSGGEDKSRGKLKCSENGNYECKYEGKDSGDEFPVACEISLSSSGKLLHRRVKTSIYYTVY